MPFFCPSCFAPMPDRDAVCSRCGFDTKGWEGHRSVPRNARWQGPRRRHCRRAAGYTHAENGSETQSWATAAVSETAAGRIAAKKNRLLVRRVRLIPVSPCARRGSRLAG
jgi:hypothetical protein